MTGARPDPTPVTVYYNLMRNLAPKGTYLGVSQGIETGIFVVLAVVLLSVTFWVLKRRDA
jgi:hypothetical protein